MTRPRTIRLPFPVDVRLTLAAIQRGKNDPTLRFATDGTVWRASRTPDGPATIRLAPKNRSVQVQGWGDGADWAIAHAPSLIGCFDDDSGFEALHPTVAQLREQYPGLRIGRTDNVFEALLPALLAQRVTDFEATRAFRQVVGEYGDPAPGPGGLIVPPDPDRLAGVPYYDLHIRGVERERADTLKRICARAGSLPALLELTSAEAQLRLCELPGVDQATAADAARVAWGDPDAVNVGDLNLPPLVSSALTDDTSDDEHRLLALLEPWRGHRARVVELLEAGGKWSRTTGPSELRSVAGS